jgi:hypothetical protein
MKNEVKFPIHLDLCSEKYFWIYLVDFIQEVFDAINNQLVQSPQHLPFAFSLSLS